MIKTIYTCDHCGKDVPNTYEGNYALMFCNAASGRGDSDYLHGCSHEHLGFAVAKAFGIPIDGDLAKRVDELQRKLLHLPALEGASKNLTDNCARYERERDEARKQVTELQEQLAHTPPPPNVDGKTPADVAREAFATVVQNHHESEGVSGWDAAAHAVLSAFAPNTTQAVREALGRVRERIEKGWLVLNAIDAELSALPAADLTGPKKPTKPVADHVHELGSCSFCEKKAPRAIATNCTICGCPNERAFLDPCIANGKHNF
jgi:hypothetical protein